MDARLSPPSPRPLGPRRARPWTLAVYGLLLAVAVLTQACSDNNGSTGPTFACRESTIGERPTGSGSVRSLAACTASPAPVIGDAIGGPIGTLVAQVTVNPGSVERGRRASVLALLTNANGFPVAGRRVQLTSSVGSLDQTSGLTGADGLFSTTLFIPCSAPDGAGTVTAISEGVISDTGDFAVVTAPANDPCA